jgi:succinyl-diaminopimelate desuccinylase
VKKALQDYRSRVDIVALNPHADIAALTTDLVNIPSVSGNEAALANAIFVELSKCDWLEVVRFKNSVVAKTNLGKASRVIVAGHIDTVPVADNETAIFVSSGQGLPSDGSIVPDDVVFGIGSCDMKGGVAVALRAAVSIENPQFDVTYIFYECEEVDSERNGLTLIAAEHPEWLAADIAVLLEPSNANIEAGCQGTLRAKVSTTGTRAHSARSWLGDNAIHSLGDILARLNAYEPAKVLIDGLEYREGLNAVQVSGGIAGNVIPDTASIDVNYRYAPSTSGAQAEAHIREVFDGFQVEFVDNAPGAMPGLDRPALADLVSRVGGKVAPKFGWTDVARFSAMGVPAVNLGPGDPGLAHSRNEHVSVAQLKQCEETVFDWLKG